MQQSEKEEEFKELLSRFLHYSRLEILSVAKIFLAELRLYLEATLKARVYDGGNVQIDRRSESVERVLSSLFSSLGDKLCPFNQGGMHRRGQIRFGLYIRLRRQGRLYARYRGINLSFVSSL